MPLVVERCRRCVIDGVADFASAFGFAKEQKVECQRKRDGHEQAAREHRSKEYHDPKSMILLADMWSCPLTSLAVFDEAVGSHDLFSHGNDRDTMRYFKPCPRMYETH